MKKKFALIGASGYIATRHMKAIKETNNDLLIALDKFDSVGVIDSYFPNTSFFVEYERFDRHIEKLKIDKNILLDYISICTPNYLHDAHIRLALRRGAHAICEKPLVLNPWNIESLKKIENSTGKKIFNVLQLRLHDTIIKLKNKYDFSKLKKKIDVDLTYITSRGKWYYTSWKGDLSKSGGIATNIGVHFFDMLIYVFGNVQNNTIHLHTHDRASGFLELENARVRWFLSINEDTLPDEIKAKAQKTYRSIKINNDELEFSSGFADLHTKVYSEILKNNGFSIDDARPSIEVVHEIRNKETIGLKGDFHPYANLKISKHPFKL